MIGRSPVRASRPTRVLTQRLIIFHGPPATGHLQAALLAITASLSILAGQARAAGRGSAAAYDPGVGEAPDYAFPHSAEDESRRLELLEQRLDPLTKRRIQRLGVGQGARCLEIGGGRGSITRWLSEVVGPTGRVTATDLQLGFLKEIDASNVEVLRHDIRTDTFPPRSFDLIHTRAVLMHISPGMDLLGRMVTWLAPGGWLVLEEPDFGMWAGDADPLWAAAPPSAQAAFPSLALSQGRSLRRQVHQLGLKGDGADGRRRCDPELRRCHHGGHHLGQQP